MLPLALTLVYAFLGRQQLLLNPSHASSWIENLVHFCFPPYWPAVTFR